MQTQKTLVALAALALTAGLAHADISIVSNDKGSLAMYGIADMALGSQQYSLNADPLNPSSIGTTSATKTSQVSSGASGVFNGGLSGSRLGFKGNLDVGDGIKAFFVAEAGIQLPNFQLANAGAALASNASATPTTSASNSSLNGQLFSRQANIGLSDATLGSLAFGRNYAPIYDVATQYDSIQASQLFSPLGGGTVGGGGGVSEDTRVDNSLRYMNKFSGVNTTVLYKVSTGASNGTAPATAFGLNVGYEAADWGVQVAYQAFTDAIKGGSNTLGTVGITAYNTTAYMLAGKYKVTPDVTIKGGYESYTLSAPNDALGAVGLYSYYGQTVSKVTTYADNQVTNVTWLGADYNLTSKLNLAASYYVQTPQTSNLANAAGLSATNTYVSLLADYHQTKELDAYLGAMVSTFSGDLYNPALNGGTSYNTNNSVYAVGVRYKF